MKKLAAYTLMLITFISCDKFPYPGTEALEKLNFQIKGNNQSALGGDYLPDSIGIVYDTQSTLLEAGNTISVEFEVIEGGGTIGQAVHYSDNSGKILTSWKLGLESNEQKIRATIYDSEGKLLTATEINAMAYFTDRWNTITRGFLVGIQDMVRDTVNQRSMMLTQGQIYISKDNFHNWEHIYFPLSTSLKELEINSAGEIFAAGGNGNLYHSDNWGISWSDLGKPIPENPYHYELTVTKDDYIWANKWEHGVYCSKNSGITWQKDTAGLINQEELGRIYSFADTSHLAISRNQLTILQTSDAGLTWKPLNTPEYSLSIFVTDENAIIAQNQRGFRLHKSVDGGHTYRQVFFAYVAFGTTSRHLFDKYGDDYYVLAPGGGVWKTKDFETFEELITFDVQRNLFIDHRGTIYASGFNYGNAEDDPTLILP